MLDIPSLKPTQTDQFTFTLNSIGPARPNALLAELLFNLSPAFLSAGMAEVTYENVMVDGREDVEDCWKSWWSTMIGDNLKAIGNCPDPKGFRNP